MAVAVVALFYSLLSGDGPGKFFRDSDTGWHIRTGESILAGNPLPRTDPYSFTKPGEPWFAWEWATDALMGVVHQAEGLRGVALLFAALIALCTWLWFRLHASLGGNFFMACAMASPMLTTIQLHWLARPHVFGWVFSLLALGAMERAAQRFEFRHLAGFVAGGAVWANMHASFLFLPVLALTYAAGGMLRHTIWGSGSKTNWFLLAALSSALGTLINPYGWGLHAHVLRYLGNGELLARIGEFQSFNFHAAGAWQIVLTVLLAAIGAPLAWMNRRPEHFLMICGLVALSLRSARMLPLVALLLLPLVNQALTAALAHSDARWQWKRRINYFLAYSGRLRTLETKCGGFVFAPLALFLAFVILHAPAVAAQAGFPPTEFPVDAAAQVAQLPSTARILAPDKFGGYLIYRFQGERKVFFDGRSDFYGVEFMKNYIRLVEARPGWRKQLDDFRFDYALLPNNYSLVDGLSQAGWQTMYRDGTATLLSK
jgi:hypothetical protein